MIEDIRNEQADPDDEADKGYGIDADDTAQAGFPELAYIRDQADREEAEAKEDGPQEISLPGTGFRSVDDARLQPASCKNDDQGQDEADDEFREAFPDFPFGNLASPGCDGYPRVIEMVNGPDDSQDEGPDADENVDEDLGRRRSHEDPAFLVIDAELLERTVADERIRDRPGCDGTAIALDDQTQPGPGDHRFTGQEISGCKGQDEQFYGNEDDDD